MVCRAGCGTLVLVAAPQFSDRMHRNLFTTGIVCTVGCAVLLPWLFGGRTGESVRTDTS